jgi:hypothetical protein
MKSGIYRARSAPMRTPPLARAPRG